LRARKLGAITKELDKRIQAILDVLARLYPEAHCELSHANVYELLVATILSAQTTDVKVNKVTPALFRLAPDAAALSQLTEAEVEPLIRTLGLGQTKAKNLIATAGILRSKYRGEVPQSLEELTELPGVGRKTAAVVRGMGFAIPAMPVDTHVLRVSVRLGLASGDTPVKVERELTALLPAEIWINTHHRLIWHGRRLCLARKPLCADCGCRPYCPYA
jgi:endonuclease-3